MLLLRISSVPNTNAILFFWDKSAIIFMSVLLSLFGFEVQIMTLPKLVPSGKSVIWSLPFCARFINFSPLLPMLVAGAISLAKFTGVSLIWKLAKVKWKS